MDIRSFIGEKLINVDLKASSKNGIIDELSELFVKAGKVTDIYLFKKALLAREAISSTALEEGIAIPHCKSSAVKETTIAFGLHRKGVEYESLDGEPSKIFFMIAAPEGATDAHVECLAKLTSMLLDDDFRENLLEVKSAKEVLALLDKGVEEKVEDRGPKQGFYVAVTACPTGIAHTYMSAEALVKAAKDMNVEIKVETNGSAGVKNALTAEDIAKADGVIIAADKNVETARFDGKRVVMTGTKAAIRDAKSLIEQSKEANVFKSDKKASAGGGNQRTGFYKHLMSGVSAMLPFVIGGGILIALSFIFDNPSKVAETPIAKFLGSILMTVGGSGAFSYMVPILAGFIALSIADKPAFMPGMVAGYMAANYIPPHYLEIASKLAEKGEEVKINPAGFLGAIVGGFLAGYIVKYLKRLFAGLPEVLEGIKPVLLYPFFGLLITGFVMHYALYPLIQLNIVMMNFLNGLQGGNLIILGLILGGMMAVDMGGPINKASFAFGIMMIAQGNKAPHAAVMAGGMVPPLAIAIASTILFRNKYNKEEREAGLTNYVMGASFITEGAIPFAAADPIRVIPSLIVGSAVAGALSMVFGCELPVPHGGLFVIPLVKNAGMYIVSILIGSLVSAVLLGVTKKKK